jgi:hypothetical protein
MTTSSFYEAAEMGNRRHSALARWLSRLFLVPPALLLTLIAFRYITNPIHAASPTGVALTTPEALTDTRVVGALALTIAFAIGGCVVSLRRLKLGHVVVIALMAFILAVRMFGFAQDGTTLAMGDQKVKTIGETVFLVLNAIGFVLQSYLVKATTEER